MYVENRTKIANFPTPRVFNAAAEGVPLGILYRRRGLRKLEWWGFQGRKSFPIGLAVLIQYRSAQPATQPASHVAVAITLNAKASSLKSADHVLFFSLPVHITFAISLPSSLHDPLGRRHWSLSCTSSVSKSLTALFGMRHLTYGTNFLHLFAFLVSRPPQSALLHRHALIALLLNR